MSTLPTVSSVIQTRVKEALSKSKDTVVDGVVNSLIEVEIERRKGLVEKTLTILSSLEKELKKFKADNNILDASGNVVQEGWTRKTLDEKKATEEKLNKLEKALDNALTSGDYSALEK